MPFRKFFSQRLLAHDIDYVCDLFSPFRLQKSNNLSDQGNAVRSLLGIILDYVLTNNSSLLRFTQSQRLQELFFFTLLRGELSSYLEAGANDGILYSNTYGFYSVFDCYGICIEANPRLYQALEKNRPTSINMNAALTSRSGEQILIINNSSHGLFGSVTLYSDDLLSDNCIGERSLVKSITITDVLESHSLSNLSFLSLDIEGSEIDALSVLTHPIFHTACIEVNSLAQKEAVASLLTRLGYSCYHYPFATNELVAISSFSGLNIDIIGILDQYFAL